MVTMSVEQQSTQPVSITHDEEFWYPDGSIILIAGATAFRVYQGILVSESTIFSDLLSLPQPDAAENIDGCPTVRVTDSPEDLRTLLRFLLNPGRRYFMHGRQPIAFSDAAALVRLGHKYQLEIAQAEGLRLLKSVFTTSFDQQPDIIELRNKPALAVKCDPRDAITAIVLARLTVELSMLPTAFYMCCSLNTDELMLGNPRPDGSSDYLSPLDLATCMEGQKQLMYADVEAAARVFTGPQGSELPVESPSGWYEDCMHLGSCRKICSDTLFSILTQQRLGPEPLRGWGTVVQFDSYGLCGRCTMRLLVTARREFRDIWSHLPEYFSLSIPPMWS